MTKSGIAIMFLGVMAACAVEAGGPGRTEDEAGEAAARQASLPSATERATESTEVDALQPGPIRPHFCFQFYQGAGNYFQCSTTGAWFTNRSRCIDNCSGGSCTLDVICGPGGMCDCSAN